MQTDNMQTDILAMCPQRGLISRTVVFHARLNETKREYALRFADVVLYARRELQQDIERIQAVQTWLLCSGYGLSNVMILEVGPLYEMS